MSTYVLEHIVEEHVKIVYVCKAEGHGDVIGDVPGLKYCFSKQDCLEVNSSLICWSPWMLVDDLEVRFEGAYVGDELKTIAFQARNVNCSLSPEDLYSKVINILSNLCH
ncbi:MAG: hypothetical protein B7O98_02520 [Zestosphaera tikiterensis]|uniref:Uncharacterized protein n=1 Tax=Zestosphaera tikiterensis TaxID=1973259 RepID=A0A2R7Y8Y3_9CREN|nr:MAG: hypothetical protein B7O98_02520 [Zestosphaera tikiterensis]